MERRRHLYALAASTALSLGIAGALSAQVPADPGNPGAGAGPSAGGFGRPIQGRPGNPFGAGRDPLRDMTPQDRQRFQQNIERWRQLPANERSDLRERERLHQERIRREAEAAMRDSGLQLENEKRQQYELRYMQERRRVEQELRRDLQDRRQRELAPLVEQLKREFAPQQPSASPATSRSSASPSAK